MSLDVYLRVEQGGECPHCHGTGKVNGGYEEVYDRNITHNLTHMADEAGIYKYMWRPEEVGVETAGQLIEPLEAGLTLLRSDPARFKQFNPPNKWGDYEGLCEFVEDYLQACRAHPEARIGVSR